jgi:hypothetical protein
MELSDNFWGPAIHVYTRADALEDGELVDVSGQARSYGFVVPVALTGRVWAECVDWSELDSQKQTHQDQSGRLHDVLWMASRQARRSDGKGARESLQLYVVPRDGHSQHPQLLTLCMTIGPGDAGEPVITILFHDED